MKYTIISTDKIQQSMMGNPEMIKQFVMIYLQQSPIDFQTLEDGFADDNIKTIGDSAHHIKPTMEYIGASSLRESFQNLEDLCKEGASRTLITEKFEAIKPRFQLLMEELESFALEIETAAKNKG